MTKEDTTAQEQPPETDIPERVPEEITILDTELEKLQQEAEEYKQKYTNLLAESENARKRMQKEREAHNQYAVEQVLSELLRPIDQLESALSYADNMSDDVKNWAVGFQMILTVFKDVLVESGVTSYESKGKLFDPHWHEAVEAVETEDVPPGTVLEELLKGYRKGDRIIRPARVKVAKAPQQEEPAEASEDADSAVEKD